MPESLTNYFYGLNQLAVQHHLGITNITDNGIEILLEDEATIDDIRRFEQCVYKLTTTIWSDDA